MKAEGAPSSTKVLPAGRLLFRRSRILKAWRYFWSCNVVKASTHILRISSPFDHSSKSDSPETPRNSLLCELQFNYSFPRTKCRQNATPPPKALRPHPQPTRPPPPHRQRPPDPPFPKAPMLPLLKKSLLACGVTTTRRRRSGSS